MRAHLFIALLALGCSQTEEPPPVADEIATAEGDTLAAASADVSSGEMEAVEYSPIGVEVRTHGISALHRSFLADPEGLHLLGSGLAGLVPSPAQVFVSYNEAERFGLIALRVPPDAGLITESGEGWSIARVPNAFAALDTYREHLGSSFDLRLASFRVSIQFVRGGGTCSVLPENDRKPLVVSPCVQLGEERICGATERDTLTVEASVSSKLRACFR